MNKTTTALTDALIKGREIASEHPYKIVGNPDTYSQYNEAWQDCADRFEQLLISLLQKEREDMKKCLNTDATAHPHTAFVAFVDAFTGKDLADVHFDQSFTQYKTTDNE